MVLFKMIMAKGKGKG